AADLLLDEYCRITKDPVQKRLPDYLIAYSCFRMAFTQSAANSMTDASERVRLQRESETYNTAVVKLLEKSAVAP
ncbi:MAG TPA: hypothetical protein VJT08_03105, partial [Terriglobales bacterium]|nr:hypothetical protein [Terriglobales bacterium]